MIADVRWGTPYDADIFAMGEVELLLRILLMPVLALLLLYAVVRLAVKHGTLDAAREREADVVRRQLGVGPERSPNSGS